MRVRVTLAAVLILLGGYLTRTSDQPAQATGFDGAGDAREAAVLRVASYNIRHGRGMDGVVDLERIAGVLRDLEPDIVALQEVDDGVERSGGVHQHERLGELLGMHAAFASFMDYQGGRYGLALLSRYPLQRTDTLRLVTGNEPRAALAIHVDVPGVPQRVTVVNVHFDWVGDDGFRFAQATHVAEWLDALHNPWLLVGDLNDEPGSRTVALFEARAMEARKPEDARFTFPSPEPLKEIDYIFAAPAARWTAREVRVVPEGVASDHRPVFAVLIYADQAPLVSYAPF
jgi:endonuclease/exonuclease/phosphatase family metal-dependent hydrolase